MRNPVIPSTAVGPAVHALVIGVGHYQNPNLAGLEGAAKSALAFATWLHDRHKPPGFARGSIDVLASKPDGQPVTWQGKALDPPTTTNVQQAVDALHARVDPLVDDMVVFYFCGHGIEMGDLRSLLLEDVDPTSAVDPFRNAIAFDDFVDGMASCGPRKQVYVLDACRELPLGFGQWDDNVSLGQPMMRPNLKRQAKLGPRVHVVLDGASPTQKAWECPNGGWFTDALLTVLEGAAGDNRFTPSSDEYSVSTRDITDVVKYLASSQFLDPPAGPQDPKRRGDGDLDFHIPVHPPVVPVLVTRRPPSDNTGAQFEALQQSNPIKLHTCVDARPWRDRLPVGDYVFKRDADSISTRVKVPATKVELP